MKLWWCFSCSIIEVSTTPPQATPTTTLAKTCTQVVVHCQRVYKTRSDNKERTKLGNEENGSLKDREVIKKTKSVGEASVSDKYHAMVNNSERSPESPITECTTQHTLHG